MRKIVSIICVALALPAVGPAVAAVLTVTGKVTRVASLSTSNPGDQTLNPPGTIAVGDRFTLTASFDIAAATLTSLYDADPTINIYNLPGTTVSATIGGYSTSFIPRSDVNSSLQIWNDHVVTSVGPVDSQCFSFFNYDFKPVAGYPFAIGSGSTSESITFDAFDFTAAARGDDLISHLAPLAAFASQSFSYGLLNADTGLFFDVQTVVDGATLAAVPEPAIWALLLLGFGMMAIRLRAGLRLGVADGRDRIAAPQRRSPPRLSPRRLARNGRRVRWHARVLPVPRGAAGWSCCCRSCSGWRCSPPPRSPRPSTSPRPSFPASTT